MWIVLAALMIGNAPRIESSSAGHDVVLTMAMIRAIDSVDPTFRPWRDRDFQPGIIRSYRFSAQDSPFAMIGDYNGDGRADAAIVGRTRTHGVLLVLLSQKDAYRAVVLRKTDPPPDPLKEWYGIDGDRREYGLWVYLSDRLPAGAKIGIDEPQFTPRFDCFEVDYWQKAASAFCWDGHKFREIPTAD